MNSLIITKKYKSHIAGVKMANEKWCYFNRGATQEYDSGTNSFYGLHYKYDTLMERCKRLKRFVLPTANDYLTDLKDIKGYLWVGYDSGIVCKVVATGENLPYLAFGGDMFARTYYNDHPQLKDYDTKAVCGFWLRDEEDLDDGLAPAIFLCMDYNYEELRRCGNGPFDIKMIVDRVPKTWMLPFHLILK